MSTVVTFLRKLSNALRHARAMKPIAATRSVAVATLLIGLLSACYQPHTADDIADYGSRLARTLNADIALPNTQPILVYPTQSALFSRTETISIDLTELYQIQTCKLGSLVAQRNTALGKVQAYSLRLQYEYQIIKALQACISFYNQSDETESLVSRQSLLPAMQLWLETKVRDYTRNWSNMMTLSAELKQAYSRPLPGLLQSDNLDITGQVNILAQLTRYRSAMQVQPLNLESQLQQLGILRLPASVWLTQKQIVANLAPITSALNALLPSVKCGQGKQDDKAAILRNVFYLFFIEKIQPVGSRINAFQYAFKPISDNWQSDTTLPDAFKSYLREQDLAFNAYQQVMAEHVKTWQQFLTRCRLSPTP